MNLREREKDGCGRTAKARKKSEKSLLVKNQEISCLRIF